MVLGFDFWVLDFWVLGLRVQEGSRMTSAECKEGYNGGYMRLG